MNVKEGEVVALLGQNGSGRTTMLRSILGLTPARKGHIKFGGVDITNRATHEIARMGIGWVPDDRRVFPTLTVARNLAIAQKETGFRPWSMSEVFNIFSALEYLMERECENLSVEKCRWLQSAGLARITGPGVVRRTDTRACAQNRAGSHDSNLASQGSQDFGSDCDQNITTALKVSDRGYVMDRGRIVLEAPADELLKDKSNYAGCWGIDFHVRIDTRSEECGEALQARAPKCKGDVPNGGRLRVSRIGDNRCHGAEWFRKDHSIRTDYGSESAKYRNGTY